MKLVGIKAESAGDAAFRIEADVVKMPMVSKIELYLYPPDVPCVNDRRVNEYRLNGFLTIYPNNIDSFEPSSAIDALKKLGIDCSTVGFDYESTETSISYDVDDTFITSFLYITRAITKNEINKYNRRYRNHWFYGGTDGVFTCDECITDEEDKEDKRYKPNKEEMRDIHVHIRNHKC